MTRPIAEMRLDGNAAAGLLASLFAFDITEATIICDDCEHAAALGELHLYAAGMGAVLRCPGCSHLLLCATDVGGAVRLDMRGVRLLRIESR